MHIYKKLLLLFTFFLCFNRYDYLEAQNLIRKSNTSSTQDFSKISVDQLSDADVAKIQDQLQINAMPIAQAEQIALAKGMPQAEWNKLKARILQTDKSSNKVGVEPTLIQQNERQTADDSYRVYQKAPSSDVFGSSFFNTPSLSFEPNLRIATPANYILGPDDELLINVSGYQETNIKTSVQSEGTIFIPQVGSITVVGLTIEQATSRIKDKMAQTAYPSLKSNLSKLIISLGTIRSIHITIVGAAKPGNYTISSLATVFNSLYQCGGPDEINTYRDIELIRNNKVYQKIDIYQFLTRGDQKGNVPLKDGDVINFPVYKKHVTIKGQVKRPGIYELREGETFENLLFFAGGYTDKAYKASIKVKQITDTERKIKDIAKADVLAYQPSNGDEFQVDSVLNRFENAVTIKGAVYRPGEFELTPGITIGGLIKRAGGLQENVFTDRATLTRTYPNGLTENITFNVAAAMNGGPADIALIKKDDIRIAFMNDFRSNYKIQVDGEVRKPGTYPYSENLSLKDVLFMSGGFTDAASSYHIEVGRRIVGDRINTNVDSIAKVFTVNTGKDLAIESDKFVLEPYDIITIRRNPGYNEQQRVNVTGEINYPGNYTIQSKKEHISDLLKRAGGLTLLAYPKGIYLIRHNAADKKGQQQEIVKNIQGSIKDTSAKVITDVVNTNFRIPVNLKKVLDAPGSVEDYVLMDGDSVQVLKVDPLVKLSGEVLSSTKTGFIEGKSLDYYLTQAGGVTDNARKAKIYVLYANGHINRTNNGFLGLFRSYPKIETGAEIIVPRKNEKKGLSTAEILGLSSGVVSLISLMIVTVVTLTR